MKCSICGTSQPIGAERCPTCGCRFREEPVFESAPHRGCASKLLILSALLLCCFLLVNFSTLSTDIPVQVTTPRPAIVPSVPAATEDCFSIAEGMLLFLPEAYEGGPVLRVPEFVAGQAVTAIGPGCFENCTELTTILLPDTVEAIHSEAFSGCRELRGLFVPQGTKLIGKNAFAGCRSLEAVYIPGSVETIASNCFDECGALMYIFYEGFYNSWDALYDDFITPFTGVFCLDGDYYHAAGD